MNLNKILVRTILLLFASCYLPALSAQHFDLSATHKVYALQSALEDSHIKHKMLAPEINERFTAEIAEALDDRGRFFTQREVDRIRQVTSLYPVQTWEEAAQCLDSLYLIVKERLAKTRTMLRAISDQDFSRRDSIVFMSAQEPLTFPENEAAFQDRWTRNLKYLALASLPDTTLSGLLPDTANTILNEALRQQVENAICQIGLLDASEEKLKTYVLTRYLRTYANCFDPHTEYFSVEDEKLFSMSLSTEMYSTGLFLNQVTDRIIIEHVVPNSAAGETGLLTAGDEITAISFEGQWRHPACLPAEVLEEIFFGIDEPAVKIRVKSAKDQNMEDFVLEKRKIGNLANQTIAYVLHSKETSLGYISLPSFYTVQAEEGTSSGQDLAVLLLKMSRKDLDGVVIDLRNNGGGSIAEAIDLVGFFINYGPVFQVVDRMKEAPYTIKDTKKGKIYTGKVMFIVNNFSASASEMMVSALKNYPDILVAGSETYGKSTGQEVVPLSTAAGELFGFAKITTLQIYNLDGTSYQGSGVVPDITIPDGLPQGFLKESKSKYFLRINPIDKEVLPTQLRAEPIEELSSLFHKRLEENTWLLMAKTQAEQFESMAQQPYKASLVYDEFVGWPTLAFPEDTTGYFQMDELDPIVADTALNQIFIEDCLKDPVLNECVRIFEDWIDLTSK